MQEISKTAYRYAFAIYAIAAAYFWYLFYSLWFFLGKNVFPQNVSSILSIQNSNFQTVAIAIATVGTVAILSVLLAYRGLREYVVDVGDELSRVAWPSFKDAQKSTGIVILLVLVVGFFLFFADTIFQKIINFIMLTAA